MTRTKVLLGFLVSMTMLIGCSTNASENLRRPTLQNGSTGDAVHDERPWENILFRFIDERIKGSGTVKLMDRQLADDEMEVRIWSGFDLSPLRALILRKNGTWQASYLQPLKTEGTPRNEIVLDAPRNGWNSLWARLDELNFKELPDATEIDMQNEYLDGHMIVVEIRTSPTYRAYHLFGLKVPKELKREPVRKMATICSILSDEFQIDLC